MRSLFAKILAWFVGTLIATIAAMMLATALTYRNVFVPAKAPFSMMLNLELTEARNAWENGGPARLRETLLRFREVTYASDAMLTDGNGTDLLTGASRADLLPYAKARLHAPFSIRSHVFGQTSPDGLLLPYSDPRQLVFLVPPAGGFVGCRAGGAALLCAGPLFDEASPPASLGGRAFGPRRSDGSRRAVPQG